MNTSGKRNRGIIIGCPTPRAKRKEKAQWLEIIEQGPLLHPNPIVRPYINRHGKPSIPIGSYTVDVATPFTIRYTRTDFFYEWQSQSQRI